MREAYGAVYSRLYAEHWWWRSREALVLHELERIVKPPAAAGSSRTALLDVGCGDGLLLEHLGRFGDVEGVEVDERLVSETTRERWPIHLGPLADYRPDHRFDVITALDVVEHIEDDGAAFRQLAELLRPGGRILLTVPALQSLWTHHDEWNLHFRRYSKSQLKSRVEAASLHVEHARYCFGWMVVPKCLVRLREKVLGPSGDVPQVPPALINRTLELVSRFDHHIARRGWWPLGSSLLLVATKPATSSEDFPATAT